jgi:flagellar biosynthesis/type III secretory pathway protein FliH
MECSRMIFQIDRGVLYFQGTPVADMRTDILPTLEADLTEALENGYDAMEDEFDESYDEGHSDGVEAGREYANDEAYDEGFEAGRDEGYDDGYKDGEEVAERAKANE